MSTATSKFIGRNQEITFLTGWLQDTQAPSIVYIHDALEEKELKGGAGKSTLLTRFYELVVRDYTNIIPVRLDFFEIRDRDAIFIAEQIIRALRQRYPHWSAQQFNSLLDTSRQELHKKKAETSSLNERLADAFINDLQTLQQTLIDDNAYVLLFLDTYEFIERNPIVAVLQPARTFPDNYQSDRFRFLIAGRNALDWSHPNWRQREAEVYEHALAPFSCDEMAEYLTSVLETNTIASLSPEILQAFHEQTRGRPILVGLVADVLNKQLQSPEKLATIPPAMFEASLVEEIHNFQDPQPKLIFAMAHVYHRFDVAFLERLTHLPGLRNIASKWQCQELMHELSLLSFTRGSSTGERLVLHDEMRRLVTTYCLEKQDEDERMRRELSELALTYYDQLIEQEKNEETRRSYIVERLFHELFLDREKGFRSFK